MLILDRRLIALPLLAIAPLAMASDPLPPSDPVASPISQIVSPLESQAVSSFRYEFSGSMERETDESTTTTHRTVELLYVDGIARVTERTERDSGSSEKLTYFSEGHRFTRSFAGLWLAELSRKGPEQFLEDWFEVLHGTVADAAVVGEKKIAGRAAVHVRQDKESMLRSAETDEIRAIAEEMFEEFAVESWIATDSRIPLKTAIRIVQKGPDDPDARKTVDVTHELTELDRKLEIDLPPGRIAWPGIVVERFDDRTYLANMAIGVAEAVSVADRGLLGHGFLPVSSQIEDDWTRMIYDSPEGRLELLVAPIDEPPARTEVLQLDAWRLFEQVRQAPIRTTERGSQYTVQHSDYGDVETAAGSIAMMLWQPLSDQNDTVRLREALITGQLDEAVSILAGRPELLEIAIEGDLTPLMLAMRQGQGAVVRRLVGLGAEVDAGIERGHTALNIATVRDDVDMVRLLLDEGADPNPDRGRKGRTAPLIQAAERGYLEIARLLLDAGARIDARNDSGFDALSQAAFKDHPEVLRLLLERGADPDTRNVIGLTPLHGATRGVHPELVTALLAAGADANARSDGGNRPIFNAARHDTTDVMTLLLESDADIHVTYPSEGESPLHFAAKKGSPDMVSLLLRHGAAVEATTDRGRTALMLAAEHGAPDSVAVLLRHGAGVNARSRDDLTPLVAALRSGRVEVAETLVAAGARVDEVDTTRLLLPEPRTVAGDAELASRLVAYAQLMFHHERPDAVAPALREALRFLIDEEPSSFWENETSRRRCPASGDLGALLAELDPGMVALLLEHPSVPTTEDATPSLLAFCAAQFGNVDLLRLLHEAGLATNEGKAALGPLLVTSSTYGRIDVVGYLLELGAPVESIGDQDETPLIAAAINGHAAVVEALLGAGAELTRRDGDGVDAHGWAVVFGQSQIARGFRERGAVVTAPDIEHIVTVVRGSPQFSPQLLSRTMRFLGELALEIESTELATRLFEEALDLSSVRGFLSRKQPDPTWQVGTLFGLALSQARAGQFADGHDTLRRAVELLDRGAVRGLERSYVLAAWGDSLFTMGREAEARQTMDRALEAAQASFGPSHPFTRRCMAALGGLLTRLQEPEASLELFERALALIDEAEGTETAATAGERVSLLSGAGRALTALSRYDEAERVLESALELSRAGQGTDESSLPRALTGIGVLHRERGSFDEAEAAFREAIAVLEPIGSITAPAVATVLIKLAEVMTDRQRPDEARPLLERAVELLSGAVGDDRPVTVEARERLRALDGE